MGRATDDPADGRRLQRSSTLAGVGDGALAVALLLLAAGVSPGPLALSAVVAGYHLPWAVLALTGTGAFTAADQRTLLGLGSTLRAAAMVVVGGLGLAGLATPGFLVVVALVAGGGAALADAAEEAVTGSGILAGAGDGPDLRRPAMAGMAVVGLPLGGLAYEVAAALPFLVDVGVFAVAALSALAVHRRLPGGGGPAARRVAVAGLAPGTGPVTALAVVVTLATSAVLGVLALLATDDLGLGAPAFGLVLAGLALAGVCGALAAPTAGAVLGLRGGTGAALVLAGAGYAGAGSLADPARPLVGVAALGV
ncbi:MAG TPA: hypothetical protein VNT56_10305, partial [Acidimicrobiales bacterium]|nr:hypothetical protein [Acidimicrobiales bacterium]